MNADHLEILVEEPSLEAFLHATLPSIIGNDVTYAIHVYQGKSDLLKKLESRLRAYAKWLPESARILVLLDEDREDCRALKARMEAAAAAAALKTCSTCGTDDWRVANRIVVEELEAWYFGEWNGVRTAYPRLNINVPNRAAFRHCDEIAGGTWEAFERILQSHGYFAGGLRKVEAATAVGSGFDPNSCNSPSFSVFRDALVEAVIG